MHNRQNDKGRGPPPRRWRLFAALLLILHGLAATVVAQEAVLIDRIRFAGNDKTRERVFRQEMLVKEGDPVDMALIEKSRQAIMNLGLFKTVKADVLEEDGANVLLITVDERYYLLPLPLLDARLEEKEYSFGVDLRHDNMLGLNHRLKVTYENKKSVDGEVPMRKEGSFSYSYPRIYGSLNNLGLSAKVIREDIEEVENGAITGGYRLDAYSAGFRVSRWLNPAEISEGWLFGIGMAFADHLYSRQTGTGLAFEDSQALEVNVGVDHNVVKEFPYHREGSAYGYAFSMALPGIGSDYSYIRHSFYHRNYQALKRMDANVNTQLRIGLANGSSFDTPAFSIGGGSSLRGYDSDAAIGNALLQVNMEYHRHVSGYRQLRGVLFIDAGNAWPGVLEVDLSRLLSSAGVGMRWRVQSFVDVTLRVDAAYALDTGETKVYAATSGSF